MKVKVVKCSSESYWYKDRVGEEFDVEDYENHKYNIISGEKEDWIIYKSDCEVIQEKPYPKMMYVWDEGDAESKKGEVVCKHRGKYVVYDTDGEYYTFDYAQDLPERTKLTKQQIADKFGVDIELLDIEDK